MDRLMSIGQFSNRCGLSVKVLRSYAEAGLLVPAVVDTESGYRYYDPGQLGDAELVVLLRRAGIAIADIASFLAEPTDAALQGWERSLVAEVHGRREALAVVRSRLGLDSARTRGATMVEIRAVRDRAELQQVFDLLASELPERGATKDRRHLVDLDEHFPADQPMMVLAFADGRVVGGALAFRSEPAAATLRIAAVASRYRHRGIGRRLVERVEGSARLLGVERIGLGTDEAVGFWYHLGYVPHLLFQWVYDPECGDPVSEAVLAGPLKGRPQWRSSFNGVPQLFVELDEPRLDLHHEVQEAVSGGHVGFVMFKTLGASATR